MSADLFVPGMVAVVTVADQEHVALRDCNDAWLVGDIEDLRVLYDVDELVTGVFPLYVLDVRKAKKVEALEKAIGRCSNVTAAIVSLTKKPPEPTNFGAVVRDVDGKKWLRDGLEYDDGGPWFHGSPPKASDWERRDYADISVVEILQLGVPA